MIRVFRYPLRPTIDQTSVLDVWLWRSRELYNGALQERISSWKVLKKSVTRYEQQKSLTIIRSEDSTMAEVPAVVLRSALKRLDLAYRAFFRRVKAFKAGISKEKPGFPRFRSWKRYNSFSLMETTKTQEKTKGSSAAVWVRKIGWVKFHQYRELKGKILDVTFRREPDGNWFVSFQCDLGAAPPKVELTSESQFEGSDVGLSHFATFSDGSQIKNPRFFRKAEATLANRQRKLSSKVRGSQSRLKAKRLVAKAHLKVKNQRLDFARKLANSLYAKFDAIVYEDLAIKEMIESSANSADKRNLPKSINDAAWQIFIQCLISKAENAGKWAIGIDPRGTTQRCSGCDTVCPKGLHDRVHHCIHCGLSLDRDHNAAINIKSLGLRVAFCRSSSGQTEAEVLKVSQLNG